MLGDAAAVAAAAVAAGAVAAGSVAVAVAGVVLSMAALHLELRASRCPLGLQVTTWAHPWEPRVATGTPRLEPQGVVPWAPLPLELLVVSWAPLPSMEVLVVLVVAHPLEHLAELPPQKAHPGTVAIHERWKLASCPWSA